MTLAPPAAVLLPSFQRGDWYQSRDRLPLDDGSMLCLTPELDVVAELMQGAAAVADWAPERRAEILCHAARLFAHGSLRIGAQTQTSADFAARLNLAHGLPPMLTEQWSRQLIGIVEQLTRVDPDAQAANLFVSLPANTFLCLESVYHGLWTGHRVFLRPSQREPWSALRLVAALVAAGVPRQMLTLVNVPHTGLPRLIRFFDAVILYGGQAVAGIEQDLPQHVTVKGPGCSVALVSAQWGQATVAAVARLVSQSGGRLCTNVRWVLVEGRQAEFGKALAQALGPAGLAAALGFAGCEVHDPASTSLAHQRLSDGLRGGDTIISSAMPREWQRGQPLPALVVQVDQAEAHPLLRAEPPFPLALVTGGSAETLASTFAHSAFVYQVDPAGAVTGLRFDGVDGLQENAT